MKHFNVDRFVRNNLYDILQLKGSWIVFEVQEEDKLRLRLRKSYFTEFFGSEKKWMRKGSRGGKSYDMKRCSSGIKQWLMENYPTHEAAMFSETSKLIFNVEKWSGEAMARLHIPDKQMVHKTCLESCEDKDFCKNRWSWIECSDTTCKVKECKNRESQEPFVWTDYMRLQYVNAQKGAGVFSKRAIRRGSYLGTVTGEALQKNEALLLNYNEAENDYAFEVDPLEDYTLWMIDPKRFGNILRFVNSSCDPNCKPQVWTVNNRRVVKFVATKDIEPNTELTFTYGWENREKTCYCGTALCGGFI